MLSFGIWLPYSGETVPLDLCLNVLARALEENKDSSELWYHYLKIYRHHPPAEDIAELCETALACTPSYRIYRQVNTWGICPQFITKVFNHFAYE